jgi:nucleotide-binding universal stress UspA family protein
MRKLLLPTDFSENSWNAIEYALKLFEDENCTFYLLNTYTPRIYKLEYFEAGKAQFGLLDAMKEVSLSGLEEINKKIEERFNNPKHVIAQISSFNTLTDEIKELLNTYEFDAIVMGTKGATGAKEILFGSNTVHIIKSAKCPVLAIPDNFEYEVPREILFPSDYEIDYNKNKLKLVVDIASKHHSRINLLHVATKDKLSKYQHKNKQKVESVFGKNSILFHSIRHQKLSDAINDFQLKYRINLLVMINNKRSFFENLFFKSTISDIGFHLSTPFLVINGK